MASIPAIFSKTLTTFEDFSAELAHVSAEDLKLAFPSLSILRCTGLLELLDVCKFEVEHRNDPKVKDSMMWPQITRTVAIAHRALDLGIGAACGFESSTIQAWDAAKSAGGEMRKNFCDHLTLHGLANVKEIYTFLGETSPIPLEVENFFQTPIPIRFPRVRYDMKLKTELNKTFGNQDLVIPFPEQALASLYAVQFLIVESQLLTFLVEMAHAIQLMQTINKEIQSLSLFDCLELNNTGRMLVIHPNDILNEIGMQDDETRLQHLKFGEAGPTEYPDVAVDFASSRHPIKQQAARFYELAHKKILLRDITIKLRESIRDAELLRFSQVIHLVVYSKTLEHIPRELAKKVTPLLTDYLLPMVKYLHFLDKSGDKKVNGAVFLQNIGRVANQYHQNSKDRLDWLRRTLNGFQPETFSIQGNLNSYFPDSYASASAFLESYQQKTLQAPTQKELSETDIDQIVREITTNSEKDKQLKARVEAQKALAKKVKKLLSHPQKSIEEAGPSTKIATEISTQKEKIDPEKQAKLSKAAKLARELMTCHVLPYAQRVSFWHGLRLEDVQKVRERQDKGVKKYAELSDLEIQNQIRNHSFTPTIDKVLVHFGDRILGRATETGRSVFLRVRNEGALIEDAQWGFLHIGYTNPHAKGQEKGAVIHRLFTSFPKEQIDGNRTLSQLVRELSPEIEFQDVAGSPTNLTGFDSDIVEIDPEGKFVEVFDARLGLRFQMVLKGAN